MKNMSAQKGGGGGGGGGGPGPCGHPCSYAHEYSQYIDYAVAYPGGGVLRVLEHPPRL